MLHLVDSAKDGQPGFFPDITAQELLKNKKAQQDALTVLQRLQKFNVWLDAIVSVSPGGHMIITSHTQLKAY